MITRRLGLFGEGGDGGDGGGGGGPGEYDYGGSSYRDTVQTETTVATTVATVAQPANNLALPIIAAVAAFLLFGS